MQPWLLFLTITIEGYVVLAAELLAIRQLSPYVGNGTDTISIIIAAVLLPLAIGYYAGGRTLYTPTQIPALRARLVRNLLIAGAIFTAGFIHIHLGLFFEVLSHLGITNRLVRTVLYCSLFLVYPTYLLGQTIPLASQALPPGNLARLTGRMLCYSTLGSFMGSIFSTLVLMAWVGVHNTFTLTLMLLMVLVILLTNNARHKATYAALLLLAYTAYSNSSAVLAKLHIVQNNAYNQVAVFPQANGTRILSVNGSSSSRTGPMPHSAFAYVEFIERAFISRLPTTRPQTILVIGAGGFTMGLKDTTNRYIYLDIDPALKATSENHFLQLKITSNKTYVAQSARPYLQTSPDKFDLIILDAFSNRMTPPADLLTQEFFTDIRNHLAPGGTFVANIITSPTFATPYSRAIDLTLRSVFPFLSRQWLLIKSEDPDYTNIIYSYTQPATAKPQPNPRPYTDLLNRYFLHH